MGDFFRGWCRKIGCITLVMASMVSCLWFRSYHFGDWARCGGYDVISQEGKVSFTETTSILEPTIRTIDLKQSAIDGRYVLDPEHYEHHPLLFYYGTMAVPLTVLSLWFLLWPRRKSLHGNSDDR